MRFHNLRHSTTALLLEQGIDFVVIEELLGHPYIGVVAGVYAHVRLRLRRQARPGQARPSTPSVTLSSTGDDPPAIAVVR
ncbi:tyrosine-type recombinase/integrase [Streptomyces sp. HF10]|uniref:tyrosine-type recombinase/integrase n=1 Tax=Streptomyces sp. HF10 TaxID=2692233 RepID=UPI003FA7401E